MSPPVGGKADRPWQKELHRNNLALGPIYVWVMFFEPRVSQDEWSLGSVKARKVRLSPWLAERMRVIGGVLWATWTNSVLLSARGGMVIFSGANSHPSCCANCWSIKLSSAPELMNAWTSWTEVLTHTEAGMWSREAREESLVGEWWLAIAPILIGEPCLLGKRNKWRPFNCSFSPLMIPPWRVA